MAAAAAVAAGDAKCLALSSSSPKRQSSRALSSVSKAVSPSPRKGKRKSLNSVDKDGKKPILGAKLKSFQAPPAEVVFSETPTMITKESIQSLIESRIFKEMQENTDGTKLSDIDTTVKMDTRTLHGWCLVDALVHCGNASNGILAPLILEHGPPGIYMDHILDKYKTARETKGRETENTESKSLEDYPSFRALCRTVAGQQLAGKAAVSIWRRLVGVVTGTTEDGNNGDPSLSTLQSFTPETVLAVVEDSDDTEILRKPAGLSRAKCDCILAIARSFRDGSLSEAFLTQPKNDEEIRSQLLSIKGLGPWSVDMFLMFRCHRSNLLPIGDLAVRNGTGVLWKANHTKSLCAKKDAKFIAECHAPFEPYRSVSSYYMYKVADSVKAKKKKPKGKKGKN